MVENKKSHDVEEWGRKIPCRILSDREMVLRKDAAWALAPKNSFAENIARWAEPDIMAAWCERTPPAERALIGAMVWTRAWVAPVGVANWFKAFLAHPSTQHDDVLHLPFNAESVFNAVGVKGLEHYLHHLVRDDDSGLALLHIMTAVPLSWLHTGTDDHLPCVFRWPEMKALRPQPNLSSLQDGITPLHFAYEAQDESTVRALLDMGARSLPTRSGVLPEAWGQPNPSRPEDLRAYEHFVVKMHLEQQLGHAALSVARKRL